MFNKTFKISNRKISSSHKPYIVSEMSGNHKGELKRALLLVEKASNIGANALKLQTYTPDTMTIKCNNPHFQIKKGLWTGYTLHDLYEYAHTPWDWHKEIFDLARDLGLHIFSTPFDKSSVDFLEKLDVPVYKIASFEITDLDLIKYVSLTQKPIILSTGMANIEEIEEALTIIEKTGNKNVCILYCVSGYPTPIQEANILSILDFKHKFDIPIGFSDHTLGTIASVASISLGACLIEKHMTLNRKDGGPDAEFSLEPDEFSQLIKDCNYAWSALGSPEKKKKDSEKNNIIFRRSIFCIKDIKKGEIFTHENIRVIRPGYGIKPKYLKDLIGKKATKKILRGTPISFDVLENC
jgi:pseudaminic acid synthase